MRSSVNTVTRHILILFVHYISKASCMSHKNTLSKGSGDLLFYLGSRYSLPRKCKLISNDILVFIQTSPLRKSLRQEPKLIHFLLVMQAEPMIMLSISDGAPTGRTYKQAHARELHLLASYQK